MNLWSSCLNLPNAVITIVCHHSYLTFVLYCNSRDQTQGIVWARQGICVWAVSLVSRHVSLTHSKAQQNHEVRRWSDPRCFSDTVSSLLTQTTSHCRNEYAVSHPTERKQSCAWWCMSVRQQSGNWGRRIVRHSTLAWTKQYKTPPQKNKTNTNKITEEK